MNEGDVVLTPVPQADGQLKPRPAVVLREMPRFRDFLVCGVSTQLHQVVEGFDDLIDQQDEDFPESGLIQASIIRLGFLAVVPRQRIAGSIGRVSLERHRRLLDRLASYLLNPQ